MLPFRLYHTLLLSILLLSVAVAVSKAQPHNTKGKEFWVTFMMNNREGDADAYVIINVILNGAAKPKQFLTVESTARASREKMGRVTASDKPNTEV